ncbi:MAG TPA: sulfotransferase [Sphingomicrobium sp.]
MTAELKQAIEAFQTGDLERARTLAQAELSDRESPEAHHLLGLVHCRMGDAASGVEHLRVAAEAEPANIAFQIMWMRALVDSGRAQEVMALPEPPPIRSAAALELWRARGEAADAAEDYPVAVKAWSKVTAATPSDWKAWANLGRAYTSRSQWREAADALAAAVRLKPDEASLRWSHCGALASADRPAEALSELDGYEQLAGRTAGSVTARARWLLASMKFDEAEQAYRDAIELAPDEPTSYRELGLLLERRSKLDLLANLLDEAAAAGITRERLHQLYAVQALREGRPEEADKLLDLVDPAEDCVGWHRLKSKIADRLGKFPEAFAAAAAMNRAAPQFESWISRGEAYRNRLRSLGRTLSAAPAHPQLDSPSRRMPAFLVGFPRSGTTLLDTLLMGHSDTVVLEEVHLLGAAEREIGRVADLALASRHSLERAREAYFRELDANVDRDFSGLVVDKLPLNLPGAPFIEAMFPRAPIIFAQRHPCDAVLSGFMQSFVMNDAMASFLTIEGAADLYDAVMSAWRAMREAFPLNVHTVRYERLVSEPEAELRPLTDFLGLDWDEQMLAHTQTAKRRGTIITPSYDQVTEPLNSRSVGRWKKYREQLEPVLPVLLPWAEWLGYED